MASTAQIRKLSIQRFRGIQSLTWLPAEGMNVILGGGDVGKTTVLEAIALLLSPSNTAVISGADYWARDSAQEFVIEAVMSLPDATGIGSQNTFAWPWAWNGKDAVAPSPEGEGDLPMPDEPVYRVRVRGTTELELAWEVMQPNDEFDHFSTAVRRRIGLVRMSADERNDRDLRLVYGSALDRLLADNALRARIGKEVAGLNLHDSLNDKGKEAIESLDGRMAAAALPSELKLGLTTSQGLSIGALIGLMATKNGVALPLSSWGAGTRRMAALEIASATDREASVTLIDEIERGLEPQPTEPLPRWRQTASIEPITTSRLQEPKRIRNATPARWSMRMSGGWRPCVARASWNGWPRGSGRYRRISPSRAGGMTRCARAVWRWSFARICPSSARRASSALPGSTSSSSAAARASAPWVSAVRFGMRCSSARTSWSIKGWLSGGGSA